MSSVEAAAKIHPFQRRWATVLAEVTEHLPYTIASSAVGMTLVGLLTGLAHLAQRQAMLTAIAGDFFHLFHPLHLLFSAITTTAMFWRHDRRFGRALLVGFFGTVIPCGLSDYYFPYLGGQLLNTPMELHVCLFDHPLLIVPFIVGGMAAGFLAAERVERSTFFSHAAHVFVSSMASLLYLVSFGLTHWMSSIGLVFVIVVLAVWIPCCLSDIVIPLLSAAPAAHHHDH